MRYSARCELRAPARAFEGVKRLVEYMREFEAKRG